MGNEDAPLYAIGPTIAEYIVGEGEQVADWRANIEGVECAEGLYGSGYYRVTLRISRTEQAQRLLRRDTQADGGNGVDGRSDSLESKPVQRGDGKAK